MKGEARDVCRNIECIDLTPYGITLPGFIDLHTHLRGLELAYKEEEYSGTRAAARGGYTAVVDMPNTIPRVDNLRSLELKLEKLRTQSVVDFGISVAPPLNGDLKKLKDLISRPEVVSIGEVFPEELHLIPLIVHAMHEVSTSKPIIVHPEVPELIGECKEGYRWICRPLEAEWSAIMLVHELVGQGDVDVKIHITHVTNPTSIALAKRFGFTVDTAPHYLYLSSDDELRKGCIAKVNPPLRHSTTNRALLTYTQYLDAIATDHAPHSLEEKSRSFMECPSGIASLDVAPLLILDLVSRGFLSLSDVVRLLSLGPAKILGLNMWGCFEPGCIASYTIVNLEKESVIDSSRFASKAKFSPYDGMRVRGSVAATIVRGEIVQLEGEIVVSRPIGIPLGYLIWGSMRQG